MTMESVARGPKGNLHFLTGVHELCECSFILLFLGATEAEVCDVLGIAAAFADKEGGHRHSSDDICHPCKVPVVQDFGESDMENEWNSRKSPGADMRSGSLAMRSSRVSKDLLF